VSIHDFTAQLSRMNLPWWVGRTVSGVLAFHAVITGWDYYCTPESADPVRSLKMVEKLATLHTWGIWYMVAGGVLAVGLVFRRHALVWLGHALCAALYAGFTVAILQAVWAYALTSLDETQGPLWRAFTSSLAITVVHALLCWIRGPIPRKGDEQ
jgi:hypothetical protein